MLKVNNSRKSKMTKKQYFIALGALVAGMAFTSPVSTLTVHAEDEVLFEDTTDDYKTEDIKEEDIVRDNTVVEPEEQKQEEQKQEEQKQEEPKQEEKKEEKKNECITEDNGYDEEAGKKWDPSIKTEPEEKGLTPETPPSTPPETPPETPSETPTESTQTQVVAVTNPAPAPAPKTGDLSIAEILGLIAGLSVGSYGISSVITNIQSRKRK